MNYVIQDYSHEPGWVHYVSDMTTSVEDSWTTAVPLDQVERGKFGDPTPIKQFKTKSEARPYLDALKSARAADWQCNQALYKARGYRKPAWKIYPAPSDA